MGLQKQVAVGVRALVEGYRASEACHYIVVVYCAVEVGVGAGAAEIVRKTRYQIAGSVRSGTAAVHGMIAVKVHYGTGEARFGIVGEARFGTVGEAHCETVGEAHFGNVEEAHSGTGGEAHSETVVEAHSGIAEAHFGIAEEGPGHLAGEIAAAARKFDYWGTEACQAG